MLAKIAVFIACFGACSAHQCLLSPPQRSPLNNINKAGSDSCILLDAPCGNVKPTDFDNRLWVKGGTNLTVIFQKNLDHFNAKAPGNWSISLGSGKQGAVFKSLWTADDSATPSLTLITASVYIAVQSSKKAEMVLQTAYMTNNPQAPPAFYQCADIVVFKGDDRH